MQGRGRSTALRFLQRRRGRNAPPRVQPRCRLPPCPVGRPSLKHPAARRRTGHSRRAAAGRQPATPHRGRGEQSRTRRPGGAAGRATRFPAKPPARAGVGVGLPRKAAPARPLETIPAPARSSRSAPAAPRPSPAPPPPASFTNRFSPAASASRLPPASAQPACLPAPHPRGGRAPAQDALEAPLIGQARRSSPMCVSEGRDRVSCAGGGAECPLWCSSVRSAPACRAARRCSCMVQSRSAAEPPPAAPRPLAPPRPPGSGPPAPGGGARTPAV